MGDFIRLVVVIIVTIAASVLAFVGRIDATAIQTIYLTAVAYSFGYAHGTQANGGGLKGG